MTALATSEDVAAALGRTLTVDEYDRVDGLLETASAAVEAAAGNYRFTPGSYTITRLAHPKIRIPATVDAVSAVNDIDCYGTETELTDWTLRGSTLYGVVASGREVEIAFTVTADVPVEVAQVTAGIVAATLGSPPVGASSQQAGPFSVSYADSSGRVWLSASDRAILAKYRTPRHAIELA